MTFSEAALQQVREDRFLIDELDRWLFDEISPYLGRRVIEIGCGLGNIARHLTDRDLYIGTEASESSIAQISAQYGSSPNMQFRMADVTHESFAGLASLSLDTVFSLNVFEHIENDAAAIRNAARVLQPGGRFILVVPAHAWLYGSIDRAIGHYRRYNKKMVAGLFTSVGLACRTQKYLNLPGAVGWFINGRLLGKATPPQGQLSLFNRLVPLIRRFEQVVPVPAGISLLSIGEKEN